MSSYTVQRAKHATLAAGVVDTVNFTASAGYLSFSQIEVLNRGSAEVYLTTNGSTPTVGGNDTFVVVGGGALKVPAGSNFADGTSSVSLISASATAYSATIGA